MKWKCEDPKRSLLIYQILVSALTLLGIGLRTANLFFFFDREMNYYTQGFLPGMETGLLFGSVVVIILCGILWFRRTPLCYPQQTPLWVKLAALLGALCAILYAGIRVTGGDNTALIPRALLILSVVAAVYWMLGMGNIQAPPAVLFVTGVGLILWLLAALVSSYFDMTVQMNAPDKVLFLFACFCGMLFTVEELRMTVGNPRRGLYAVSTGIAVLFLGVAVIPSAIGILAHMMKTPSWSFCLLPLGGFWSYALARLWSLQIAEQTPNDARDLPGATEESKESEEPVSDEA